MKKLFDRSQMSMLAQCATYQKFLERFLELRKLAGSPLSYAEISRRLGMSSRIYPRDIFSGAKPITPAIVPKLIYALGLNGDLKMFLTDLVELSEIKCRTSGRSEPQILKSLEKTRQRILMPTPRSSVAFSLAEIPIVYAALGSIEVGATQEEIQSRTGLRLHRIEKVLETMLKGNLCSKEANRYFAQQSHLSMEGLKTDEIFKTHFIDTTKAVSAAAERHMNSDDRLFFSSAFSVKSSRLNEMKDELRSILLKYVDSCEVSAGDKVISLVCALH